MSAVETRKFLSRERKYTVFNNETPFERNLKGRFLQYNIYVLVPVLAAETKAAFIGMRMDVETAFLTVKTEVRMAIIAISVILVGVGSTFNTVLRCIIAAFAHTVYTTLVGHRYATAFTFGGTIIYAFEALPAIAFSDPVSLSAYVALTIRAYSIRRSKVLNIPATV